MDYGIKGRVALVAAGSKGIGFAIAQALAAEGAVVSICSRSQEHLDHAVRVLGGDHIGFVCDVSRLSDLETWVQKTRQSLGVPTILVSNCGGPPAGFLKDVTDADWQSGVDSTLFLAVRLPRMVWEGMAEQGYGRIIHVTSIVAKQAEPILAISSMLRAGIMALTTLQAREYGPYGITVNAILPGHTLTERQLHLAEKRADMNQTSPEDELHAQSLKIPVGRLASPQEIAAPTAYLCSSSASFVSGVSLQVDGGESLAP